MIREKLQCSRSVSKRVLEPEERTNENSQNFGLEESNRTIWKGTGGSVGWASGCYARGCVFDSDRTNTQGLKITEERVQQMVRLSSLLA